MLPISFFFSLIADPGAWLNFFNIFDAKMISWLFLSTILHQILQVVMTYSEITSMITMGVINQLRILGTLIISNFTYHQTHWNFSKLFGAGLLFCGGIIYSVSRMKAPSPVISHNNSSNTDDSDDKNLVMDFKPEMRRCGIDS